MWQRQFTLARRLHGVMLITSLLVLLLGLGGYAAISRAQADFEAFAQGHLPLVVAVNRTRESLGVLAAQDETDVVMNYSLPDEARRLADRVLDLLDRARISLAPALQPPAGAAPPRLAEAAALLQTYRAQVTPVFEAAAAGRLASRCASGGAASAR